MRLPQEAKLQLEPGLPLSDGTVLGHRRHVQLAPELAQPRSPATTTGVKGQHAWYVRPPTSRHYFT